MVIIKDRVQNVEFAAVNVHMVWIFKLFIQLESILKKGNYWKEFQYYWKEIQPCSSCIYVKRLHPSRQMLYIYSIILSKCLNMEIWDMLLSLLCSIFKQLSGDIMPTYVFSL